ncbi:DUF4290 domain-containing protein [Chitinophaga rhizosphaerae]|uniref:DUF4290 domain-containing protein n=1 Tax=Chitinophaga rhizosphaerae TaxID=1864947 RepID=UPI000F803177|nr:DUF4290 domain-containing protein [Chitinophaga rhizosphaerae]
MEYNTARNHLIMREYGRNVQRMIEYILTLKDREHRQQQVSAVIELMGILQPHLRNVEDFRHKLWDHLFLVSDFRLDVDSPYPIPTRETLRSKPERLPYPKKHPRHRHFGKNLERVIDKALATENPEMKDGFVQVIGNYMKLAYGNWHKENVHDDAIRAELSAITHGELQYYPTSGNANPAPVISMETQFRAPGNTTAPAPNSNNNNNKRKQFQQNNYKQNKSNKNKHKYNKNRNK